ncbi:MAG: hypothetical protein MSG64_13375 [Pyrinomonadaceae bacterium MAG19_C2-C3]|nr:hypothetical protein [Pyrinomonadaceae bacterium MAG19_C2-C3]
MASITGRVTDRLEPLVSVRLMAGREVECLVDTGFVGGALVLPQSIVDEIGLPVIGHEDDLWMVGNEKTTAALAAAQIEWLGEVKSVIVIVKDDLLIGSQLLENTQLVIDYEARTLTINRKQGSIV